MEMYGSVAVVSRKWGFPSDDGFATLTFHMESFRTGHMKRENDLAKVQFFGLSSGEISAEVLESVDMARVARCPQPGLHCRYPIPSYDSS